MDVRKAMVALGLVAAGTGCFAYEEVFTPYERGGLGAPFSLTQIDPFEPKQRWGSEPRVTYEDLLRRAEFIYRYYRRVLGFSEEEIALLKKMDREADPGSFAYVSSREPSPGDDENYRGILRIAAVHGFRHYFTPLGIDTAPIPLPVEQKYAKYGLDEYVRRQYPRRVELGRFASDDTSPTQRIATLTRLLRATALFLTESFRDGMILIESPENNRELYEQYGFTVDGEARTHMPEGRHLMAVSRDALAELLVAAVERARYIPGTVNLYSFESAAIGFRQLNEAARALPPMIRRYTGAIPYYRAWTLATGGRAREALSHLEALRSNYAGEPEFLSLELHVRALAAMDPWEGLGSPHAYLAWLRHPDTVRDFQTQKFDRYTFWNDRLYWEAMFSLLAGDHATARRLRDNLVEGRYQPKERGRRTLDRLGESQVLQVQEAYTTPADQLWYARFLYQSAPIGLSPTFTRFCSALLEATGNDGLAANMRHRALALEQDAP